MESIEGVIGLLLYCIETGEEVPDKELLKSRSPIVQSNIDDNIETLDKITGEGMYKNCEHLDSARFYIYEDITNNNADLYDLSSSVDLYERLRNDDPPTDDEGNLLFGHI